MGTSSPPDRTFVEFTRARAETAGAGRRWLARARDFGVEWLEFGLGGSIGGFASDDEALVIVVRGPVRIDGTDAAPGTSAPSDSVAIVPAGTHVIQGSDGARCAIVSTRRRDVAGRPVLNAERYAGTAPATADGTTDSGPRFARAQPLAAPQVLTFDEIKASPEKPRLKMLQTETLSINIVDYRGPRDRSALSPHSHADFEQGSLALEGHFVHHLRTPWGSDADQWRDDEHLGAPSPSLVVIPPHVIHTTEGTGEGRHLLIDLFSPPRQDFIASRWVFNSGDYRAAAQA